MIANRRTLEATQKVFHELVYQNLVKPLNMELVNRIATIVPSTTKVESYNWITAITGLKEWVGEKEIDRMKAFEYQITNRDWEDTIEVNKHDFEDNTIGQYRPALLNMGEGVRVNYLQLLTELLENGFSQEAYDGASFFGAHDVETIEGVATYDNSTDALLGGDSFMAVMNDVPHTIKTHTGRSMGVSYDTLICHPSKRSVVKEFLKAEEKSDGSFNDARDEISYEDDVIFNEFQSDKEKWFLIDSSAPILPLVLQIRKQPEPMSSTEDFFKKGVLYYGIEARHNVGYSFPQFAYGSDGTGS